MRDAANSNVGTLFYGLKALRLTHAIERIMEHFFQQHRFEEDRPGLRGRKTNVAMNCRQFLRSIYRAREAAEEVQFH